MELTLSQQTQAFVYSCALGAMLAAVYTALGILKIMSPPGKKLLFAMDLVFMLVCTFVTFLFSVAMTWGSLRYYVVLGELLGFFLFYLTVGELLLKCSKAITYFVMKVYFVITAPFRKLARKLLDYLSTIIFKLSNILKTKLKPKRKHRKLNRRTAKRTDSTQDKKPRIMALPKKFEE